MTKSARRPVPNRGFGQSAAAKLRARRIHLQALRLQACSRTAQTIGLRAVGPANWKIADEAHQADTDCRQMLPTLPLLVMPSDPSCSINTQTARLAAGHSKLLECREANQTNETPALQQLHLLVSYQRLGRAPNQCLALLIALFEMSGSLPRHLLPPLASCSESKPIATPCLLAPSQNIQCDAVPRIWFALQPGLAPVPTRSSDFEERFRSTTQCLLPLRPQSRRPRTGSHAVMPNSKTGACFLAYTSVGGRDTSEQMRIQFGQRHATACIDAGNKVEIAEPRAPPFPINTAFSTWKWGESPASVSLSPEDKPLKLRLRKQIPTAPSLSPPSQALAFVSGLEYLAQRNWRNACRGWRRFLLAPMARPRRFLGNTWPTSTGWCSCRSQNEASLCTETSSKPFASSSN